MLEEARALDPQGIDAIRVDLVEGIVRCRQGDLESARSRLERARVAGGQLLDPQLLGPLYAGLAETALAQGDVVGATAILAEALELAIDTWHPVFAVPVLTAGVAVALRDSPSQPDRARELVRRAEVAAAALDWSPPVVEAELAWARAEVISGDRESWAVAAGSGSASAIATGWPRRVYEVPRPY